MKSKKNRIKKLPKASVHIEDLSGMEDEDLLEMFVRGEQLAFNVLLARYKRPLMGFIFRFLQDREASEDIFQETYLKIIKNAATFKGQSRFKTWLFKIARNLCIDRLRHLGVLTMVSADQPLSGDDGASILDRLQSPAMGPLDEVEQHNLVSRIEAVLTDVPIEQREVFILRAVLDMPFAEIAHVTGVSENTVKSRMRYAMEGLRKRLADLGAQSASEAR
ncbi:MAG: sigma-70 family RNA polymerase sigma factor [Deltaproteobacteria bacterium]|nr:sigma-70 family RNA polymerase sigma factor [Deltaproteobacteria bacterium]